MDIPGVDAALLRKLDRLGLTMREMARAQQGGARRSRARGTSVEFADYRSYAAGDDFRRIDWSAFGRLGKLYIKLFLEERESVVSVFLDASSSMSYGEPDKGALAKGLCASLAYVGLCGQDRVAPYIVSGARAQRGGSLMGKGNFPRIRDVFASAQMEGRTLLGEAVSRQSVPQGGLSIIVTDLFSDDDWKAAVNALRFRKQDVAVIHLLAREEVNPPFEGRLRLIDSETGDGKDIQIDQRLIDEYKLALGGFREDARKFCHQKGAAFIEADTGMMLEQVLFGPVAKSGLLE